MSPTLPIHDVLDDIRDALEAGPSAVIQAPPGAGKTTGVPLALLEAPFLAGQKIVMLEPRRLAARASATRMAEMLGEQVGKTVGYRIRMEKKTSEATRIEVVTEGILTRMIQSDPELSGIGLVIFDEFHERNLNSDLGLALTLECQGVLRDDLRILIMSATLDAAPAAALLGDAPVITSEGRAFPVTTCHLPLKEPTPTRRDIEAACARAVARGLAEEEGDMLVFLPGAGEIRRVEERLRKMDLPPQTDLYPLFGALTKADQDKAIKPSPAGRRKVVLATAIAETSLTIDGVTLVVDAGLMRVSRFSPGSGMGRLVTLPVSKASADQRRGRAGRTAPGTCYRLWSEARTTTLTPFTAPEILSADLAPLVLELALWGVTDPAELTWLDVPPEGSCAQARDVLQKLGALDEKGRITAHGKAMTRPGVHPRLAHMILMAKEKKAGPEACLLAALLTERDPLTGGRNETDIRLRMEAMMQKGSRGQTLNPGAAARIRETSRQLSARLGVKGAAKDPALAGRLVSLAFPDRIAMARPGRPGHFQMASGGGAVIHESDPLAFEPFVAVADLDGNRQNARVYLAAPLTMEALEADHGHRIAAEEKVFWNEKKGRVEAVTRRSLGAVILSEKPLKKPDAGAVTDALIQGIQSRGLSVLPWNKTTRSLQARVLFLRNHAGFDELPDLSETALETSAPQWLAPFLIGITSMGALSKMDLAGALTALIPYAWHRKIDRMAPTHMAIPSGTRIPLDYGTGEPPVLAARIQQLFGLTETPKVADGRIHVTCHLLSPASRPMQVTRDLSSFWTNTYPEVKKELKARYPKHPWPDDPLTAVATNRAKPKGRG
ncbi:ATP-dependent helicase HrpB [Desulfoluna butyratoxydans]|uniref:Atp-dependent helicase hrpb n=1 Tax=Desulfoluna butyratoxydans TaxID=231438 RepID=A0A4U8YT75_9BACT|nr:ATP-dependent helicase HrpB [Desulfoluna butyratoxydans]VFQ44513.1 atp-dependent helicase hrpb [Desulfoluna butyratoxydans]